MGSFFTELKRRNVIRVAIAYGVVSWLLIQVTNAAVPALHLPGWVDSLVFFLLMIGLPVALVFAWAFELTPEGVKKQTEVDRSRSITQSTGRKLDFAIIGLLVVGMGYFIYESRFAGGAPEVAQAAYASIAVLPFVNMSSDPEQDYFSDGISEEILNVLAQVPNLHVTSRSSAFSFKGQNLDIPTVARRLGVANVLEGSVRKSGTRVRITAQLIEAESDRHLWSATYDRELTDIFVLQDEISAAIVAALKEALGIDLVAEVSGATETATIDAEAYDLYLRGLQGLANNSFEGLNAAEQNFAKALALDPEFEAARIGLAEALFHQVYIGSSNDPAILDQAAALLQQVLETDPGSAEVYYVLAELENSRLDFALAGQYFREGYSLDPGDVRAFPVFSAIQLFGGVEGLLSDEAVRTLYQDARSRDPLNPDIYGSWGAILVTRFQDYREAEQAYLRAIEMGTDNPSTVAFLGFLYSDHLGNLAKTADYLEKTIAMDPSDPEGPIFLSEAFLSLGDFDSARAYADAALELAPLSAHANLAKSMALIFLDEKDTAFDLIAATLGSTEIFYRRDSEERLRAEMIGLLLDRGNLDEAEAFILAQYPEVREQVEAPPLRAGADNGIFGAVYSLATLYRAQGRTVEARAMADRLATFTEESLLEGQSRLTGFDFLTLAFAGEGRLSNDAVMDYLERVFDNGYLTNWREYMIAGYAFQTLRDHPRYLALVAKLEAKMARQRAELEAGQ